MNKRELLNKLLHIPKKVHPSFWGKQFRILNSLLKKFPDMKFWEQIVVVRVDCLTLYAGEDANGIADKYKKYIFQPELKNLEVKLGEKAGQDYNITVKPKTIKDFLK
jgi:hypothetical protein